ncbi:MAG TPA: hypothetical protein VHM26_00160 [Chitinophagaceae bacterium]|jgi:hypothetical protein|nr:hypothetical protein [Chitinophagaceae bacterium]
MKKEFIAIVTAIAISMPAFTQYSEGATITLNLSTEYTVPGAVYFINGETQAGKEGVKVNISIRSSKNKEERLDVITDKFGNYHAEITAKEPYGKYTITAAGADGKRAVSKTIWIVDADQVQEAMEEEMAQIAATAQKSLKVADNMVKQLPPSSAKTEYDDQSKKVKEGIADVKKKFDKASKDLSALLSAISKYPPVFEKAQPYIKQLEKIKDEATEAEKNFEQRIKQSEQEAANCDAINFIGEAAGFISLVLDFKGKLAKIFINLSSDKALPGAVDRMKWKTQGQEQENAKFKINTAQKALVASAQGLSELVDFGKTGFSLDFIQFCAKSLYGKFCEELKGPFTGDFRAEFDADASKGMWNSYDMFMKGNLVLRYEKGGDSKKGFAVSGEFEGVYTKYEFWEDFEKVEPIPAGMTLFMRDQKKATPIDPSSVPVPKVTTGGGKTTVSKGELDINNDLGLIARQLLPGSFRIKVKGKVINNKIYLTIDKDAATNAANVGQTNQLILGFLQPLLPIPLVRVFDFQMAPAKSVFTVGMGDQQVFEIKTSGNKTTSDKSWEGIRKLDNGNIRLRTRLNVKLSS